MKQLTPLQQAVIESIGGELTDAWQDYKELAEACR